MARKKHAKPHEEEAGEAWLLPYSDLMTLLLALFIALFAMSQTDASKMQALAQAFTAAFNMGGPSFFSGMGPSTSMSSATVTTGADTADAAYMKENNDLSEAKAKLDQYIQENNLQDQVSTELNEEGLMIRLKERALFASGSAALQGDVEVGRHALTGGAVVDELVAEEVGLDAAYTQALEAVELVEGAHQVDEALARAAAEVPDIDARQHDLASACGDDTLGLLDE